MFRRFLTAKVHRAAITGKELDYEGSLGLDQNLMDAVGLLPGEIVMVFNVAAGHRFETYLIPLARGSGAVTLYGAAARLGEIGDRIIVMAYGFAETPPEPKIVVLDEGNRIIE